MGGQREARCQVSWSTIRYFFRITTEMDARSLVNFYCEYMDEHINLKFMLRVSEREGNSRICYDEK